VRGRVSFSRGGWRVGWGEEWFCEVCGGLWVMV
jgi:hypothetical protein